MANKFSKGHVFVPGEVVDPDDLNSLVDLALALPPLITDQTAVNATTGDKVLVSRAGVLKQADVSTFPSGVTDVTAAATPTGVFDINVGVPVAGERHIALSLDYQSARTFLAGPVSGATAVPAFRVLSPADLPSATVIAIAALDIDWDLGTVFTKNLPAGAGLTTLTFSHNSDGQTIKVRLLQNATGNRTVSWPSVLWRGTGPAPVVTQVGGARDIFTFIQIAGLIYGYADQNFTT